MCRLFEGFCSCAVLLFVFSVFVYLWCFSSSNVAVPASHCVYGKLFLYTCLHLSLANVCEAECVCMGFFGNEKSSLFHSLCQGAGFLTGKCFASAVNDARLKHSIPSCFVSLVSLVYSMASHIKTCGLTIGFLHIQQKPSNMHPIVLIYYIIERNIYLACWMFSFLHQPISFFGFCYFLL